MFNRRSILGFLGMSPVAAPALAHEIAQGVAAGAPVMPTTGKVWDMSNANYAGEAYPSDPYAEDAALLRKLGVRGVPDFLREIIRRDMRHSTMAIDPDIAASKSFSEATKRRMQLDRYIDRAVADHFHVNDLRDAKNIFTKTFGTWPFRWHP